MARIVLADDGIEFDGRTPEQGPLGGAETSLVFLMASVSVHCDGYGSREESYGANRFAGQVVRATARARRRLMKA